MLCVSVEARAQSAQKQPSVNWLSMHTNQWTHAGKQDNIKNELMFFDMTGFLVYCKELHEEI
jgi:hypothetical protein